MSTYKKSRTTEIFGQSWYSMILTRTKFFAQCELPKQDCADSLAYHALTALIASRCSVSRLLYTGTWYDILHYLRALSVRYSSTQLISAWLRNNMIHTVWAMSWRCVCVLPFDIAICLFARRVWICTFPLSQSTCHEFVEEAKPNDCNSQNEGFARCAWSKKREWRHSHISCRTSRSSVFLFLARWIICKTFFCTIFSP